MPLTISARWENRNKQTNKQMNGPIYIPTMGRTANQKTLASLPDWILKHVVLVAPANEVKALEYNYRKVNVLCCPARGIAATRQWLVENCPAAVCTMIDDDQWFAKREVRTNGAPGWNLPRMPKDEVGDMIEEMESLTSFYPMVGLSARQGNNYHKEDYLAEASRVHNHYALDVALLRKLDIRFDRTKLMEDFYVNLSLLMAGYTTVKVVDRCWQQTESHSAGGCSTYRDAEMQKEASLFLENQFPSVVTAVQKSSKTGWFNGAARWDVRVQWKQAMEIGKQGGNLL
jgi:hypothetical protein